MLKDEASQCFCVGHFDKGKKERCLICWWLLFKMVNLNSEQSKENVKQEANQNRKDHRNDLIKIII